jgi:hypothetical protein
MVLSEQELDREDVLAISIEIFDYVRANRPTYLSFAREVKMSNQSKPGLLARLRAKFKSSGNNKLTQKQKQWINLGIGLTLFISAALIVSSMIGGPENDPATVNAGHKTPDSIPLVVPGETVNDRDRWMGNAGQQVASVTGKTQ